jgi:hypothetical protein
MSEGEWRNLLYAWGFLMAIVSVITYPFFHLVGFYWIMVAVSVVLILAFIGEHTKEEKKGLTTETILIILWAILGIVLLWVLWDVGPTLLGIGHVAAR